MDSRSSYRMASIVLIVFGFLELLGFFMALVPRELYPVAIEPQTMFMSILSGIYGVSRIIAGVAIWKNRKWGLVLGLMLCMTTLVVAPAIDPFGIIDLVLTLIVLICLLSAYFGKGSIFKDELV